MGDGDAPTLTLPRRGRGFRGCLGWGVGGDAGLAGFVGGVVRAFPGVRVGWFWLVGGVEYGLGLMGDGDAPTLTLPLRGRGFFVGRGWGVVGGDGVFCFSR